MMPPAKLGKIVEEIVDNAFKYSEPGTSVDVSAKAIEGEFFWLEVMRSRSGHDS
jgi:signal transduction histidine kinase